MSITLDCFYVWPATNQAVSRRSGKKVPFISLSNELSIYHSDISKHNFLCDAKTRRICIVDFQHIGVLPKPFQTYAFFNIGSSLAVAVGDHLGYQPSDIANTMTKASAVLQQFGGNASLGGYLFSVILSVLKVGADTSF